MGMQGELRTGLIAGHEARAVRRRWPDEMKAQVDEIEAWLAESRSLVLPESPLSNALNYIANHWAGLTMFLEDGRIEIDNNGMERSIRPLVMTRENRLFADSRKGRRSRPSSHR